MLYVLSSFMSFRRRGVANRMVTEKINLLSGLGKRFSTLFGSEIQ